MSAETRYVMAGAALESLKPKKDRSVAPPCPFAQRLQPGAICNKNGGVCSIRLYAPGESDDADAVPVGDPVVVCPARFRQSADGQDMFSAIGAAIFEDPRPTVVREVPFLRKRASSTTAANAGRIDWVVAPSNLTVDSDVRWAAVETQALYFSGDSMVDEFGEYIRRPDRVAYPVGSRRPDFRSSGPKRLSPQLDVKAPRIGRWGMNTVVVIDQYFWDQISGLRYQEDCDFDNAEVVWMVMKYDSSLVLRVSKIATATMEASRDALSGTDPVNKAEFNGTLLRIISDPRSKKVFRL